ncbi:acyltransferase family protein [Citrobacter portucalensis]|uniref:acyltransferase family protein n=2 Tax=Citrobacter TaxID=544 RepID=UPI001C7D688E|nr:acyltransferase [Citrobacter portucalensis]
MSKPFYVPSLDGLRFFAFFLVFCTHFSGFLNGDPAPIFSTLVRAFGSSGVILFFILSSYLLTIIAIKELTKKDGVLSGRDIKNYFLRRILRIWPLYFGYLIIVSVLTKFFFDMPLDPERIMGNITFTDNFFTAFYGFNSNFATGHLWTLSIEEQYYLILPFILPVVFSLNKKTIIKTGIILFLAMLIFRIAFSFTAVRGEFLDTTPLSGDAFLLGTLYALGAFDNFLNRFPIWRKAVAAIIIFIIAIQIGINKYPYHTSAIIKSIYAIAYLLLLDVTLKADKREMRHIINNKVITYLGKISFGLYVFHYFFVSPTITSMLRDIIANYFNFSDVIMFWLMFVICLLLTILTSILSYELFEKYFLKLKIKFTTISSRPV